MNASDVETWKLLREVIVHEDSRIQQRVSWLTAAHAILLAAYAATLNLSPNVSIQQTLLQGYLALGIPIMGLLLTLLVLAGIHGANLAIQEAVRQAERLGVPRKPAPALPPLHSSAWPVRLGRLAAYGTCAVLLMVGPVFSTWTPSSSRTGSVE